MSLNLAATNELLEVVTTSTSAIHVVASWHDKTASADTNDSTPTIISTATTTTVVAAPAASTARMIEDVSIVCSGAESNTITVQFDAGGTNHTVYGPVTLNSGWRIHYTSDRGWRIFSNKGFELGMVMAGYGLIKEATVLTSGTTHIVSPLCAAALIEIWGGGGAGGSGDFGAASTAGAAGGGGAGAYQQRFVVGPPATITYAIGAAGAPGAAGSNPGGNGGNTTCTINGSALVANGGTGGAASGTAAATALFSLGGLGGTVANSNGHFQEEGRCGEAGVRLSGTIACGGDGATSMLGSGGRGSNANGAGQAALAAAAGGAGGCALSADVAGGAGGLGAIRITEYAAA